MRRGEDRFLVVVPYFHVYGLVVGLFGVWQGAMQIPVAKFDANLLLKAIKEYRPTYFPGVPTLFIAGKRDAWINQEKVNGLKEVAAKYNLPVEAISYDADHAFFNDTRPEVYNPEAAKDAWAKVQAHIKKYLAE